MDKITPIQDIPTAVRDIYTQLNKLIDIVNSKEKTIGAEKVYQGEEGTIKRVKYAEGDNRLEIKFSDGWFVTDKLNKKG